MRFTIPGIPIPKKRPRFSTRGGFMRTYDTQHSEKNTVIAIVKQIIRQALDGESKQTAIDTSNLASAEFFDMSLTFHRPIPESCSTAERNAKLWGFDKCTTKPDVDNLGKFYLDCFNNQLYSDDRLVISMQSAKSYTRNPRVEVDIMPGKSSLCSEAKEILKIYGPENVEELIEDMLQLKKILGECMIENVDDERLLKTACLLSSIADKNHALFSKIHKKYAGLHLKKAI